MKIAYVGGGSFMIIPQVRNMLELSSMRTGEIALYDLDKERVQAMAAILRQSPEINRPSMRITCPDRLDEALEGADFVIVIACPWAGDSSEKLDRISSLCRKMGWYASDNISLIGAVFSLRSVPLVLDIARRLERVSPKATMIIFTNPVAINASAVNRYTSIRAFGVCGQTNFIHNTSYMMGWKDYNFGLEAEVAGINHFSWIMKLTLDGKDFYPVLKRKIAEGIDWKPLKKIANYEWLRVDFPREIYIWETFGSMIFSSEADGYPHLCFYDEAVSESVRRQTAAAKAARQRGKQPKPKMTRTQVIREFIALSKSKIPDSAWEGTDYQLSLRGAKYPSLAKRHPKFPTPFRIIKGLTTDSPDTVAVSYFNRGAINGFPDDAIMEYTHVFSKDGMKKTGTYDLPPAAVGVTRSLVEFQTLIADAITREDKQKFLLGIYAYPMCRSRSRTETFFKKMIQIKRTELPEFMLK